MGCDMVVALGSATASGVTFFGKNGQGRATEPFLLQRQPGKAHCPGDTLRLGALDLPQARHTYTVLGCRKAGQWGYFHGLNEHHVVIGQAAWTSKLAKAQTGLSGPDLVRLALERSRTARQALDFVTDLVSRHGQTGVAQAEDNVFLIADAQEAYVLEAAGVFWAWVECRERRVVCDASLVRQDWQRLAPGLAEQAIAQAWWPDDGSKLDFHSLAANPLEEPAALRRWGRAALLLEQQNGHIDATFLRRLLADHFEGTPFEVDPAEPDAASAPLCPHDPAGASTSFLTQLVPDGMPMAWCAFGPPCLSVYVPIFLDGDLPESYQHAREDNWHPRRLTEALNRYPRRWDSWRQVASQLQARFDQETDDFLTEAGSLKQDNPAELQRQATLFMQNHLEQLEAAFHRLSIPAPRRPEFNAVASLEG